MEVAIALGLLGLLLAVVVIASRNREAPPPQASNTDEDFKRWAPESLRSDKPRPARPIDGTPWRPAEAAPEALTAFEEPAAPVTIMGRAYVIDGDSLRIKGAEVRLFGVDAPEVDHPYGKTAKSALMTLCKDQNIRAEVICADVHGRTVAKCTLSDGRDLSAEMVRMGLAIDWPKHSGGIYRHLEPDGIRRKLWLADARQKGRMDVWARFKAQRDHRKQAETAGRD